MMESGQVLPEDQYNQELLGNVHPPNWVNPKPAERYHMVVIGAGSAGLVSAIGGATLGGKVAIIERNLLGGDCLNYGCVPSKGLIRSARAAAQVTESESFGITTKGGVDKNFGHVMERMRKLRARISKNDSAERLSALGIDVFIGEAKFISRDTVEVEGKQLRFARAVIAAGARPFIPPIPGLKECGCRTNETIFSLTERPERLLVLGGGPIGCELSQAFLRLGTRVTILDRGSQFLHREDPDAARILYTRFKQEGMEILLGAKLEKVEINGDKKRCLVKHQGRELNLEVDEILVGAGRAPNVQGLGLETAGVEYDKRKGVQVNDHLQTTNPHIFAAGDVCLPYKFTHIADATARIVVQNALTPIKTKASKLVIPWCTYTDPEIAHVGMYERDATNQGIEVDTYTYHLSENDRAILDGEEEGFVKVHVKRGTDKILGATIVAAHAGDMISEITLAMVGGVGLKTLATVIHPYPTQAEALRKVTDEYQRKRLSPKLKKIISWWLKRL